jgi:hypothetical protein
MLLVRQRTSLALRYTTAAVCATTAADIILNECAQLLLGDDNVASTQTVYPSPKVVVTKKKKRK